ncbi:MAG: hypothetical protein ABFR50_01815, partial [Candidatus Fermentibacteria bacterium]
MPDIIRASGILKFRWISLLNEPGLKIDLTGFEIRSDRGSARRIAHTIRGSGAKNAFEIERGMNNHKLNSKKGIQNRSRLSSSLSAYSVSFKSGTSSSDKTHDKGAPHGEKHVSDGVRHGI